MHLLGIRMTDVGRFTLTLPEWLRRDASHYVTPQVTDADKMRVAVELARRNVEEKTGGPFGAAVFEVETGRVVSVGVNVVVAERASLAHAEIMALALAQQCLGTHDLGRPGLPRVELVTSAQPCIQCFGAIWWAGIDRLVVGARSADVERITGLAEGPLPKNWVEWLERRPPPLRPVRVVTGVLADESIAVLEMYRSAGGAVYNPS